MFIAISTALKDQSYCRRVNLYQNCLQNWYTFRKYFELSLHPIKVIKLISEIIGSEFVFGPNLVLGPNSSLVRIVVEKFSSRFFTFFTKF